MNTNNPRYRKALVIGLILVLAIGLVEIFPGLKNLKSSILEGVTISADDASVSEINNEENRGSFQVTFDKPGAANIHVKIQGVESIFPVSVLEVIKPLYFAIVSEVPVVTPVTVTATHTTPSASTTPPGTEPVTQSGGSSRILELLEAEKNKAREEQEQQLKGAAEVPKEIVPFVDLREDSKYRESINRSPNISIVSSSES